MLPEVRNKLRISDHFLNHLLNLLNCANCENIKHKTKIKSRGVKPEDWQQMLTIPHNCLKTYAERQSPRQLSHETTQRFDCVD